jgi:PhnB protein
MRMAMPGGKLGHAEIKIGDSHIMLADESPENGIHSPQHFGGTPVSVLLYVEQVDTVFNQAVSAGAKAVRPPQDMFYGDRTSWIIDPFGHSWYIHTHVKDVSPEEMRKAMQHAG